MSIPQRDSDEHYDKMPKNDSDTFCVGCGYPYGWQAARCPKCGTKNILAQYGKYSLFDKIMITLGLVTLLVTILGTIVYGMIN